MHGSEAARTCRCCCTSGTGSATCRSAVSGRCLQGALLLGGTGIPLAGPRVLLDMAVQRAIAESEVQGISETAWIFSMGFTVRP